MTTYKITLHSELVRDDLHMALLDLHEHLKLYGVCVEIEPEEAEEEYKGFRLPPGKVLGIKDLEAEGQ